MQPVAPQGGSGALKWLLVILVLLILAGGGYYYYVTYYKKASVTATPTSSPTVAVVTPSAAVANAAEVTAVRATMDGFFKAYLAKDVTTINTFLTTAAQITDKVNPQELLNYHSLPAQSYKIVEVTKNGVAYLANVLVFVYNGQPGPTNPEAGVSWKLAEYRTYNVIKESGKWLVDVPIMFHE